MDQATIINQTIEYVRDFFGRDGSGHDWWHIYRVHQLAKTLAVAEGGDLFIIEMAALLHDLDDYKVNQNQPTCKAEQWLAQSGVEEEISHRVLEVIEQVSFKGANVDTTAATPEAKIVQDADRLDAIGAIGIARAFAFGGSRGRLIYDPEFSPVRHNSFWEYKMNKTATINHFYEKLLLLKDRMQTATGRSMAETRHDFMERFLEQFFQEWDVKNH